MAPEKTNFFIKGKIVKVHGHEKRLIPYRFRAVSETLKTGRTLAVHGHWIKGSRGTLAIYHIFGLNAREKSQIIKIII